MSFGWGYGIATDMSWNRYRDFLANRIVVCEMMIVSPMLGCLSALTCFNPEGNGTSYQGYTYKHLYPESDAAEPQCCKGEQLKVKIPSMNRRMPKNTFRKVPIVNQY